MRADFWPNMADLSDSTWFDSWLEFYVENRAIPHLDPQVKKGAYEKFTELRRLHPQSEKFRLLMLAVAWSLDKDNSEEIRRLCYLANVGMSYHRYDTKGNGVSLEKTLALHIIQEKGIEPFDVGAAHNESLSYLIHPGETTLPKAHFRYRGPEVGTRISIYIAAFRREMIATSPKYPEYWGKQLLSREDGHRFSNVPGRWRKRNQ